MGFYLNMLLLKPREHDFGIFDPPQRGKKIEKKCTLWEVETILNLQRISCPPKEEGFKHKTAKERAALHFFNTFFGKVTEYVNFAGRDCLAPPFAIIKPAEKEFLAPFHFWKEQFVTIEGESNCFIKPISGASVYEQIPFQGSMEEHNDVLAESDGHAATADIIMAKPLVWVSCEILAEWIEEGEKVDSFVKLKEDDHEAAAYFAMWKACVVEMGNMGANCLFLFDSLHFADVV